MYSLRTFEFVSNKYLKLIKYTSNITNRSGFCHRPVGGNSQSVALSATDRECVISNPWSIMLVGGNSILWVRLLPLVGGNNLTII